MKLKIIVAVALYLLLSGFDVVTAMQQEQSDLLNTSIDLNLSFEDNLFSDLFVQTKTDQKTEQKKIKYVCRHSWCTQKLPGVLQLQIHERCQCFDPKDETKVVCTNCGQRFKTLQGHTKKACTSYLQKHIDACTICSRRFKNKDDLFYHQTACKNQKKLAPLAIGLENIFKQQENSVFLSEHINESSCNFCGMNYEHELHAEIHQYACEVRKQWEQNKKKK